MARTSESLTQNRSESTWWSRRRSNDVGLVVLLGLCFCFCALLVRPLLGALAWALTLAVVAWPLHRWVNARVRNPNLAAGISMVLVAVLLALPAWFVIHGLTAEIVELLAVIRSDDGAMPWNNLQDRNPVLNSFILWIGERVDLQGEGERAIAYLIASVPSLIIGSLWMVLEILTTFFALFYFFRDQRSELGLVRSLLPLTRTETDTVFARIGDTLHATVYGTLLCAALQGTLGGLMFWWLGLPAPTMWGIIMGLLAIVPYLGAFVIWFPAVIWLVLQGNWGYGLLLAVWGGVVIALIDNFIYPVLVGKRMGLHSLAVFVVVIGGLLLFGASGVILGPLILAVADAFFTVWRSRTTQRRRVPADETSAQENVIALTGRA